MDLDRLREERPDLDGFLAGYLVLRETGKLPWEMGVDVPRRRWMHAAQVYAGMFGLAKLGQTCPWAQGG
jgi:hypothetical protein